MLQLLTSLIDTIKIIVDFFVQGIQSLIVLLSNLPKFISFMTGSFGYLPHIFIPFLVFSISIYVVFLIIDR